MFVRALSCEKTMLAPSSSTSMHWSALCFVASRKACMLKAPEIGLVTLSPHFAVMSTAPAGVAAPVLLTAISVH